MISYDLPKTVEVNGREYAIRSDFRAILDIITALNDIDLQPREKSLVVLEIFYEDPDLIPPADYEEAIRACFRFMDGGEERQSGNSPEIVDWEKDFPLIVAPINHIAGKDIRGEENVHWWTFLAWYGEISNDCTFAQVLAIRDKQARGKPLDKAENEWYQRNRALVDRKQKFTASEEAFFKTIGG